MLQSRRQKPRIAAVSGEQLHIKVFMPFTDFLLSKVCDPYKGVYYKFYSLAGSKCDDGDKCTKNDICSSSGLCVGTTYSCMQDCQICNGNSGCKVTTGCVVTGKCGCRISGSCYAHGTKNPVNQCKKCDIYSNTNGWVNVADGQTCTDGNQCTRRDRCRSGTCRGDPFTCPADEICVQSNVCNGAGCTITYKQASYLCYKQQDGCDWTNQYCTGRTGTCPQSSLKPISGVNIAKGGVIVLQFGSTLSNALPYRASESGTYYLMMTQNKGVRAQFSNFKVPCGGVTFCWQVVTETTGGVQKAVTAMMTTTSGAAGFTTVSVSNLVLKNGGVCRVLVNATNVRSDSQSTQSELILVDTTPPVFSGRILDGDPNVDIQYRDSPNTLSVYWDPNKFSDSESGRNMSSFEVAAGTKPYVADVADFVVANINQGVLSNLNLQHNTRYYVTVSLANRAGLIGQAASDGVLVDTTPPVAGSVTFQDSSSQPLNYISVCSRRIIARVVNFQDLESGIASFQWQLCKNTVNNPLKISCSQSSYTDFVCHQASNCTLDVLHPVDRMVQYRCFIDGYSYQLHVRVRNRAGSFTDVASNNLVIDFNPPTAGIVSDGLTTDVDFQSDSHILSATWTGFRDAVSGIRTCQLTVFEEYGTIDQKKITGDVTVLAAGKWTSGKLKLVTGKKYYVNVVCFDKAENSVEATSDGVFVDPLRPVPGGVLDIPLTNGNSDDDVDYQSSTSAVRTKWEKFKSASGIKSCSWSLSSSPNFTKLGDVAAEVAVPLSGRNYLASIQLRPYFTYYAGVRCTSNAGVASVISFSDGVMPDNTAPVVGTVSDLCNDGCGLLNDIDYSASSDTIRFRLTGFNDPHSGIAWYEWNYGVCGSKRYALLQFISIGLDTRAVKRGLILNHNVRYCVTVRATNGAGLASSAMSDGILVDTTAPKGGFLSDGPGLNEDIDHQLNTRTLSYTWDRFYDPESGVDFLTILVGSRPGIGDLSVIKSLPATATSYTVGALRLKHNFVYYGTVCASNKARMKTCIHSDGVLIDTSAPMKGVVIDGVVQPGIDYQNNNHTIAAHWFGFNDIESNIRSFLWAVGTSPNGTEISPFINVGTNVTVKMSGLNLMNGHRYYVTVHAVNFAGHHVTQVSNGVIVDITPPADPGEPTVQIVVPRVLKAFWRNFTDAESPIWYYKWAVGTKKCGSQVQEYTNVGRVTQASLRNGIFISGTTYYVSVVARNRADLSAQACSPGLLYDSSPPTAGKVRDGLKSVDIQYISTSNSISANWDTFNDPDSGIATCYLGVGTSRLKTDFMDFTEIGTLVQFTQTGVYLLQGVRYYVHVRCTNGMGLNTTKTTNGATVDATEPKPGTVETGSYQFSLTELRARWDGFDDTDTGIESYSLSIGSRSKLSSDIQPFVDVGRRRSVTATGLSLAAYQTYYVTVRAYNKAGLYSVASSQGLMVDNSPPLAGVVQDGQDGADIDWFTGSGIIGAKWMGFTDPHSYVDRYLWAIGTNPRGSQVLQFTTAGKNTSALCSRCTFTSGSRYYITVEAVNGAGLKSTVSSDGFLVDKTPPKAGYISSLTWRNSRLAVEWSGSRDAESGPPECWVVIDGIRRQNIQDHNNQTVLVNTSRFLLTRAIRCSIECVNNVGLKGKTKELTVDTTAPSTGSISVTTVSQSAFTVTWAGFTELETLISGYEWSVTACRKSVDVFLPFVPIQDSRATFIRSTNSTETCYVVRLQAVNSVGLASGVAVTTVQLSPAETVPQEACCDICATFTRKELSATWAWKPGFQKFAKNASYRWAVGTISGGVQIMQYTATGTTPNAICSNCSILQGATYFISVQASVDDFRSSIVSQPAELVIDFTEPDVGVVRDGGPAGYVQAKDTYEILWSNFTDYESDIEFCSVNVVDEGGFSIWNQTRVSSSGGGSILGVSLPWQQGYYYRSNVTCYNSVGLCSQALSDGFRVDGTPPTAGVVSFNIKCGSGGHAKIFGSWTGFYDTESGIEYYEWSLYNRTGMTSVTIFKVIGGNNTLTEELVLTHGSGYQLIIRAKNGAGLKSSGDSSTVVYDISPPSPSYVYDGSATSDIDYQSETQGIIGYWGKMIDLESGILRYEWAIGTSVGGEQTQPYESTGLETWGRCSGCILSSGVTYYVTVMAVNSVGLTTTVSSDGIVIDSTPPSPGTVFDGSIFGQDRRFQNSTTSLSCNWINFTDKESSIAHYTVCFSSGRYECDIDTHLQADSNTSTAETSGLSLTQSHRYYAVVTAVNLAGLSLTVFSDGVTVDATPPTAGIVNEGESHDIDCIWSNETLFANWDYFYDAETDIVQYEVAVGHSPHIDDVMPFTSVGINTTAFWPGQRSVGETVYVTVVAYNEAGGKSITSSDGVKTMSDEERGRHPNDCISFGYNF